MVTQQSSDKPAMSARDVMRAGGVDPDAPFEVGPFPPEMRMRPPQQSSDMVERLGAIRNILYHHLPHEIDADICRAIADDFLALEASHHAELVEELRIVAHALDRALHETGRDHDDASWWKWGAAAWKRSQAFLAKIGGDQ